MEATNFCIHNFTTIALIFRLRFTELYMQKYRNNLVLFTELKRVLHQVKLDTAFKHQVT